MRPDVAARLPATADALAPSAVPLPRQRPLRAQFRVRPGGAQEHAGTTGGPGPEYLAHRTEWGRTDPIRDDGPLLRSIPARRVPPGGLFSRLRAGGSHAVR